MRRLEPGEWVALAAVAEVLVADVVLIRRGHKPVSECIRSNAHTRRIVRFLSAHLTDTVPLDVLTMAGRWLERKAIRVL